MASTGTAGFTLTRDQMITAALRVLRVLQDGATAGSNDITNGAETLNVLLKNAQSHGMMLWTYQLLAIPLVTNQITYTIGPSGANVTSTRPLRLFEGSYIRNVCVDQTYDTQLRLLSRLEYLQYVNKTVAAIPNSIYYHPGIDLAAGTTSPSTGYGTLYVWPAPVDATRTIYCNFQRPIYDMTATGDEFDLPQEWFQWIKYQLAAEMADEYEVPEDRIMRLEKKAKFYKDQLFEWSVETAPVTFTPDLQMR